MRADQRPKHVARLSGRDPASEASCGGLQASSAVWSAQLFSAFRGHPYIGLVSWPRPLGLPSPRSCPCLYPAEQKRGRSWHQG